MRLALLGDDPDTLTLAAELARGNDHQIVCACDVSETQRVREALPHLAPTGDWESLLDLSVADAVLVSPADDPERRADQLRKLVAAGAPLLLVHPVCDEMLLHFELDMIRRDSDCLLAPYTPAFWHPGFARLRALVVPGAHLDEAHPDNAPLADAGQIEFQRFTGSRNKPNVLRLFARDVLLLRGLCGKITQLAAMGSSSIEEAGDTDRAYANLGVQLSGEGGPIAHWSVGPEEGPAGGRLSVVAEQGKAVLWMPAEEGQPWTLETSLAGKSTVQEFPDWSASVAASERLCEALGGAKPDPDWVDAARSVELAESIGQSLRRRRTIRLYDEAYTEEGAFKGLMGMIGCAILLLGLVSLIAAAAGEQIARRAGAAWLAEVLGYWPYLLLVLLVVFLLLQLLKLALPATGSRHRTNADDDDEH